MRVCVKRRSIAAMAGAIPIACAVAFGGAGVLLGTAGADEGQLDGECPSVTSTSAPAEAETSETQTSETQTSETQTSEATSDSDAETAECEPSSDEPASDERAPSEEPAPAESSPEAPAPSASVEVTAGPATSDATTTPVTTASDSARTDPTTTDSTTPATTTTAADADPAATRTPENVKESSSAEDRSSALTGAERKPPAAASVPATVTAPRIDLGLDATVPAVSEHVPGFGLVSGDSALSPAKDSPGSAEALPPRKSAGISPPAAAALCALALSFGLLARRWAMRTRRS